MTIPELARRRYEFLESGSVRDGVRSDIVRSWKRSSQLAVRPEIVDPPFLSNINQESRLVRAASPVLSALEERLSGITVSLLLAERDGLIVDRRVGDPTLMQRLDQLSISPGFVFTEDAVGTNGIGTAIELGRSMRIDGHEHFLDKYTDFTCIGVAIRDVSKQRIAGILNLTTHAAPDNAALSLIVEQAATMIEDRLVETQSVRERVLLDHFLRANAVTRGGVVVLSDRIMLANPRASRVINDYDQSVLWEFASRALRDNVPVQGNLALPDGQVLATRTTAIFDGTKVIGALMETQTRSERSKSTAGIAFLRPTGAAQPARSFVGEDSALLDGYVRAVRSLGTRAVVLAGAQGVGKTTVGRSALARFGEIAVIEGADAAVDEQRWMSSLAHTLQHTADGVLIRHAELLPESAATKLVPILDTALKRGLRCVITQTSGPVDDFSLLPGIDAESIRIPTLRERLSDLPALAAHFLGERRLAPEVVQLLSRLPWHGNVTELFSVLRTMAAESDRSTLTLADVPAAVRRAAPRRQLTMFEQAEIQVILDALHRTGGNKRDAALMLGISRATLYRKLQGAGIDLDNTTI